MSINRWMDKEIVLYIYNGILLNHKEGWISICWTKVDVPQSGYVQTCLPLCNSMDRSTPGFPVIHVVSPSNSWVATLHFWLKVQIPAQTAFATMVAFWQVLQGPGTQNFPQFPWLAAAIPASSSSNDTRSDSEKEEVRWSPGASWLAARGVDVSIPTGRRKRAGRPGASTPLPPHSQVLCMYACVCINIYMYIYIYIYIYIYTGCTTSSQHASGRRDLVPWPAMGPPSPALGMQCLSLQATREILHLLICNPSRNAFSVRCEVGLQFSYFHLTNSLSTIYSLNHPCPISNTTSIKSQMPLYAWICFWALSIVMHWSILSAPCL